MRSIDTFVTPEKAEIKMLDHPKITIHRPQTVTVNEWLDYWGHHYSSGHRGAGHFSQADADSNNRRRIANMEEQHGQAG